MELLNARIAVDKKRFTIEQILDRVEFICKQTSDSPSGMIISREARRDLFLRYPEQSRILVDSGNQIIGYWFFVSLKEKYLELAKVGQFIEQNITYETTRPLAVGNNNIYLVNIGILPSYQKNYSAYGGKLLGSFIQQIEDFAMRGIFFGEWVACARTENGRKYCAIFGLRRKTSHVVTKVDIYYGRATNSIINNMFTCAPYLSQYHPKLTNLYKEYYRRYKP